ncbi:MAG: HAMP domain-containing histidine kinase [Nocardioidaceae bacterium]|nr:HAMP domain-containing histidine kinase [Nocardioidaceae bacterium]
MTGDQWAVIAIAAGWSAAVGVGGLGVGWLLRRRSLRWGAAVVALVAVGGVVAGVVGTARAMFLSAHDFEVVLLVCLAAGLLSLGFALLTAAPVVRWSRSLRAAARELGEGGRFESPTGGPAELVQVSAELERASTRLARASARERQLESSRRDLVAWVSHDLRTPLAGLRAMTEALEDGLADDPSRYHQQMRAEVDRMTRMVDDLFELSRIHAGALQLTLESVLLEDVVGDAMAGAGAVAAARGIRLDGDVEPGVVVRADPQELSRVVSNLLMNAIRHTPADGSVEVSARAEGGAIELAVLDACGGIPDADLERVFDVAWRGSHARTPEAGAGAGLGLAIVRGIVEAHRGTVAVANQEPGCRFLVRLPI